MQGSYTTYSDQRHHGEKYLNKKVTAIEKHKKQASLFAAVGMLNTVFDFAIYNVLVLVAGLPKVPANIVSTSMSMAVSFTLNRKYVFKSPDARTFKKFLLFILITAIGLYGFQSIIIELLANRWTAPLVEIHQLTQTIGLPFSQDFVVANGAKAAATIVSMVWNYVMYDKIVFKKSESTNE